MILVDTSVWIDHLRSSDPGLAALLRSGQVATHPFVVGELALGNLRQRSLVLGALRDLPQTPVATDSEVLQFIDRHVLFGLGIGYIDIHLLASARLAADTALWTRDKRLSSIAERLKLAAYPAV